MKQTFLICTIVISMLSYGQDTLKKVMLDEVYVTGVRPRYEIPIVQDTLHTKTLIKYTQGQDLPVLLNFSSSSITFTSDGGNWNGYMYYRLRGSDQTRVNATLNGIPLNEPEDQGAYFSNYQDFFSNLGSIQVQRGVGTSSNGTPSYVGSLNFQSKDLSDSNYTQLSLGYGSFNTSRLSIATNTGLHKGWGTYIRYSRIFSDGYRHNSGTIGNTLFASTGYQDNKQSLKFTMFYGSSQNQMAWIPSEEDSIKKDRQHNPLSEDENDYFTQNLNILSYSRILSSKYTFNTSLFYNKLNGNYDYYYVDPTFSGVFNYKLSSDFYGLISNVNYFSSRLNMSLGINLSGYSRRHYMGLKPYDNTILFHDNTGYKNQFAAFYKIDYQLTSKFSLYGDIQYRNVTFRYQPYTDTNSINYSSTWNFINPKIGLNYKMKRSRVFGFVGISNREPNRIDIFNSYTSNLDPDHLPISIINEYGWNNVKPERVYDFELGYDFENKNNKFATTLFYMYFKDGLLPVGQLNSIGLPINSTVDGSFRRGIEMEYSYRINKLMFFIGYTLMDSKILTGNYENNEMLLTPNLVSNFNIQYSINRFDFMLVNKYVSSSYLSNSNSSNYLPEYLVTNFNTSYTYKKVSIGINMNNLFGFDYYTSGMTGRKWSRNINSYFVGAPRNIFINLNYTF